MGRGRAVKQETRIRIAELDIEHPDWTADRIREEVDKEIRSKVLGKGPGLSAVQKELTSLHRKRKTSEGLDEGLEAPWGIAASAKYGVPIEANEDLLSIWKLCIVVGRKFTIREAQWVARLRGVVPFDFLLRTAIQYSIRDQACSELGLEQVDTADLDAHLAFVFLRNEFWAYLTAFHTGAIRTSYQVLPEEQASLSEWGNRPEDASGTWLAIEPSETVIYDLDVGWRTHTKLPEEADMVWALWMKTFSKAPEWRKMSREVRTDIVWRLYEEVAAVSKESEDQRFRGVISVWEPSPELLAEVGIEPTFESHRLRVPRGGGKNG